MIRVAVSAGWTDDDGAFSAFAPLVGADGRWRELELVRGRHDVLLLFDLREPRDHDPAKTIVFEGEPRSTRDAEIRYPYPRESYLGFFDLERHHFVGRWYVTPEEASSSPEKTRVLSTITSGIGVLPRHRLRRDFIARHLRGLPELDEYGREADGHATPLGALDRKADGLLPYRYTFAAENTVEPNYFSEKLVDAVLCETLVFYDGCPNAELFVDPATYVPVDMAHPERAITTIRNAIDDDLWSERRDALRAERERLLVDLNPFEIARRIVHGEPSPWRVQPGHGAPAGVPVVFDPSGAFVEGAEEVLGAAPHGSVAGAVGARYLESGAVPLPHGHELRRFAPGSEVRATALLGEFSPGARGIDPPVFYVPGPHMLGGPERAPLAFRPANAGWYQRAHRAIKHLPRGQRIARAVVDRVAAG